VYVVGIGAERQKQKPSPIQLTQPNKQTMSDTDLRQLPEIKALKLKPRTFVLEYLSTGNGTQSAITAKYEPKYAHITASKLLSTTKIKAALEACYSVIEAGKEYTPSKIKAFWVSLMEDKDIKPDTRVRCSELLARASSMFTDNVVNVALFSDGSVKELLTASRAARAKLGPASVSDEVIDV